jgi:hypothetical protein
MRTLVKLFPLFALLAHIALWVVALTTVGRLEGPYPTGFDAQGNPTTLTEGGAWILPAVGLFILFMAVFVVAVTRRLSEVRPAVVNIPRKRDWVQLPTDARLRVLEPWNSLLYGIALFANLMLISFVFDTFAVATRQAVSMPESRLWIALIGIVVLIALSYLQLRRRIGDELRAMRRQGG